MTQNSIHPDTVLGHGQVNVSNLKQSIDFYQRSLGFNLHRQNDSIAYLGAGQADLLVLTERPGARAVRNVTGLYHFAILVPSRVELAQSLRRIADTQTPVEGFSDHLVSEAIYLPDPDGNGIEIYRDRPRSEWEYPNGQLKMGTDPLDIEGVLSELAGQNEAWPGLHQDTILGHIHLHVAGICYTGAPNIGSLYWKHRPWILNGTVPMLKINLTLMQAGYCTHPEFMVRRGGRRQSISFPALFALLEHPNLGLILFDTGYTPRFFAETRHFPYSLYAKIAPVYINKAHTALAQLKARGIAAAAIRYVIISHFHADHVGGLVDFPDAEYIYFDEAYEAVRWRRGFSRVRAGFLAGLLPCDFEERSLPVKAVQSGSLSINYGPFEQGWDLLGDDSLTAVPLPGHADGQIGLFLDATGLGPVFLAADACWQSIAYRELIWPHPLANLALADPQAYRDTLRNLHKLHLNNRELHIIPSHCQEAWERFGIT